VRLEIFAGRGCSVSPTPSLPRSKKVIPDPSNGTKCVVARLESLVMVIVMMWHLGIGHPALCRVCEVEPAADPTMLFERLHHAKHFAKAEQLKIKRKEKLR